MAYMMASKVVLVTGGSLGIGRSTAILFAKQGAKVVVADRQRDEGEETVRTIQAAGGDALFVQADVSQSEAVEALVDSCVTHYGQLNYAFNNAGIEGSVVPMIEGTEEDWETIMNINLKGMWLCMKSEIVQMQQNGGGAIVNMASTAGLTCLPFMAPYVVSKHGVIGLTKTAALEYAADNIRINAICPGGINTSMADRLTEKFQKVGVKMEDFLLRVPMKRQGTPEEAAEAVVWLCSDAASYVTGHSMVIDGGFMVT